MLELKSADGNSKAYSNVCTVICGGDKTANIGQIVYSGETPIGVVFDVNADGTPKKIVNLNQSTNTLKWTRYVSYLDCAQGYLRGFSTSLTDGSNNWNIIKNTTGISDAVGTDGKATDNYPTFKYCENLTDGGKTWYLPSRDELITLFFNRAAVNTAIETLTSVTAETLQGLGNYWSSSQYGVENEYAWSVNFYFGSQDKDFKNCSNYVRAIASLSN